MSLHHENPVYLPPALKIPKYREILRLCGEADVERQDRAFYRRLEREHPSLAFLLWQIRHFPNPLDELEELTVLDVYVGDLSQYSKDAVANYAAANDKFAARVEDYADVLARFARSVHSISIEGSWDYSEVARSENLLGMAARKNNPQRAEAVRDLESTLLYVREAMSLSHAYFKLLGEKDNTYVRKEKHMPTPGAAAAFIRETAKFCLAEIDKFYTRSN